MLLCAAVYAALTLTFLGDRPITRAQEARVLETSRQMLHAPGWHGWLVPQLNGEARLRKPPLCYWYTAAAFDALGVSEWSGRLPTLVIGWLGVVVTYFFGKDLLGRRGGFLAAAMLASSHFFIRFIRTDETDIPAMLGVVTACWGIARGIGINKDAGIVTTTDESQSPVIHFHRSTFLDDRPAQLLWFHVAAVGIALAAMSKGAPALFPLVFLALLCWAVQSSSPAIRFLVSGAPLTALVLVVPWFAYAMSDPAAGQVGEEIIVVTSGSNHRGIFLNYIPTVLHMLMPWTPVLVLAFFARPLRRAPIDLPGRVAVCTLMAAVLPLCVTLNVQPHYLIPSLPGFALVMAWTLTRALEAVDDRSAIGERAASAFELSWGIAVWTSLICGPTLIAVKYFTHRPIGFIDIAAGVSLTLAGAALWILGKGQKASAQVVLWATLMVIVMPVVGGWWAPAFNPDHGRQLAAAIREAVGDRPLIGWGMDADITLGFNMRREIRWLSDPAALRDRLSREPDAVIITDVKRDRTPLPDIGLGKKNEYRADGDIFELYER